MITYIQHFADAVWSPKTERGVMARLLGIPLLVGVLCILFALIAVHVGWIGFGVQPTGFPRIVLMLVALGVFWAMACGIWYLVGVAWFLWSTRKVMLSSLEDQTGYLVSRLWRIPLASAALCWIPLLTRASLIPSNVPRWTLAIGMIIVQLVVTYLWIALVRFILRWTRGI